MHTATLLIPSLLWPRPGAEQESPVAASLQRLLGRGNSGETARCEDDTAWLCERFGVQRQADWPGAPICLFGSGMPPGNRFWMSADPVHLNVHRDQLILAAPESLSIEDAEAVSLCAALNRHFADDGFHFIAPHPTRWYLRTGKPARIHTRGLSRAVGQNVDRILPEGEERLEWHRIFNEVQMLLHDHPVNDAREQRGAPAINSLWFSAGGTLPSARARFDAVIGGSLLAQGLAKLADIPFLASMQGIEGIKHDNVLIELSDAAAAWLQQDRSAWKSAIETLERNWFEPLCALLWSGRMKHLHIATVAGARAYGWSVTRANLLRWWRRAVPLTDPLASA